MSSSPQIIAAIVHRRLLIPYIYFALTLKCVIVNPPVNVDMYTYNIHSTCIKFKLRPIYSDKGDRVNAIKLISYSEIYIV